MAKTKIYIVGASKTAKTNLLNLMNNYKDIELSNEPMSLVDLHKGQPNVAINKDIELFSNILADEVQQRRAKKMMEIDVYILVVRDDYAADVPLKTIISTNKQIDKWGMVADLVIDEQEICNNTAEVKRLIANKLNLKFK